MLFTTLTTAFSLLSLTFAAPPPSTLGGKFLQRRDVHCGTTSDATLSDCQTLTSDQGIWDAAFNTNNICHFTNPVASPQPLFDAAANNVACYGNCCVYVYGSSVFQTPDAYEINSQVIQDEAAGLLGCGDPAVNKINGMQKFSDGHAVCLSDGNGCGDCFDDADFNV